MSNQALKSVRALFNAIGAAENNKDLIPAPGAGKRIVLVRLSGTISVTAAVLGSFVSSDLAVVPMQFAISTPVGVQHVVEFPFSGLPFPENTSLRYVGGGVGYSIIVTGEYYIENLYNG